MNVYEKAVANLSGYDLVSMAPRLSLHNAAMVLCCDQVGCYSCIRVFDAKEVEEFTDDGRTAKCPHCTVDAIVPCIEVPLLARMNQRWFTGRPADVEETKA